MIRVESQIDLGKESLINNLTYAANTKNSSLGKCSVQEIWAICGGFHNHLFGIQGLTCRTGRVGKSVFAHACHET